MYWLQIAYGLKINKSLRGFGFGPYVPGAMQNMPTLHHPECQEYDDLLATMGDAAFTHHIPETVEDVARSLHIVHVPQQQTFSLSNPSGTVHCVRLFPKESCTCPVGTVCCHILAAKHSIGLTSNQEWRVKLGQLRRNSRKRCDKKSGRKQPRKGDITFTEAPDSFMAESSVHSCDLQSSTTAVDNMQSPVVFTAAECVTSTPNTTAKLKSKKQVRFNSPLEQPLVTSVDAQQSTPIDASIAKPSARKKIKLDMNNADDECSGIVKAEANSKLVNDSSHTEHQCNKYMNDDDWQALEASCLTDNVVNAAQLLMKTNNNNGLHDTVLIAANAVKLAAGNKFVQIVHDSGAAHWLVATNLGCSADAVRIYFSLNMKPSYECVQNIMKFVNAPKSQSKL